MIVGDYRMWDSTGNDLIQIIYTYTVLAQVHAPYWLNAWPPWFLPTLKHLCHIINTKNGVVKTPPGFGLAFTGKTLGGGGHIPTPVRYINNDIDIHVSFRDLQFFHSKIPIWLLMIKKRTRPKMKTINNQKKNDNQFPFMAGIF